MALDSLISAAIQNPLDQLPRLMLADWYDDRGETDKALNIRRQVELGNWLSRWPGVSKSNEWRVGFREWISKEYPNNSIEMWNRTKPKDKDEECQYYDSHKLPIGFSRWFHKKGVSRRVDRGYAFHGPLSNSQICGFIQGIHLSRSADPDLLGNEFRVFDHHARDVVGGYSVVVGEPYYPLKDLEYAAEEVEKIFECPVSCHVQGRWAKRSTRIMVWWNLTPDINKVIKQFPVAK